MQQAPGSEFIRRARNRFNTQRGLGLGLLLAAAGALWIIFTMVYMVAKDEVAVIQRFGKCVRQEKPGLRIKLPAPIETKRHVRVKAVFTEEFGMRTRRAGVKTEYEPEERFHDESLMLTGDLNCLVVPWIVQYRIGDPYLYLFKVRDVNATLRDMAEATMRVVVGDRSIDEVLQKRYEVALDAKAELQKALDDAETGLIVANVELKNTIVPELVRPSFNEVNQAEQDKQRMINQAKGEYNRIIPAASGEAERLIQEAEGYAVNRVDVARGDASRFISLHNAYAKSKDVTRRRMYLEAIDVLLPRLGNKYVIDSDQKSTLPLLNMSPKGGAQ